MWGSICAHGLLKGTVILSDDAGQFNVGIHALCWIHMERLIHKLPAAGDERRAAVEELRDKVWKLYADLKRVRELSAGERDGLKARFDAAFGNPKTAYATLNLLMRRLHGNRDELLRVLDHPKIPLHANDSERDIRAQVTRRKISGGTRSDSGRRARDGGLSIAKTCAKNGISFWNYLGHRMKLNGSPPCPWLPDVVKARLALEREREAPAAA